MKKYSLENIVFHTEFSFFVSNGSKGAKSICKDLVIIRHAIRDQGTDLYKAYGQSDSSLCNNYKVGLACACCNTLYTTVASSV